MNMKKTINEDDFVQAFDDYNRADNFSCEGRRAMYEYLTNYEDETGELELDPIALCCEYSEFDSAMDAAKEYSNIFELESELSGKDQEAQALSWLEDHTQVIKIADTGRVIIASF